MRTSAFLADNKVLVLHDGALREYVAIDTSIEENVSISINPERTVASVVLQNDTVVKDFVNSPSEREKPTYVLVDMSQDTLSKQIVGIAVTDSFDMSAAGEVYLFVS